MEVTEQDLHSIYLWIDELPLSKPKKNFARDFSDGVLMAEVLHHYFPKLVDIHNYSPAHALSLKTYNWETLNRKVFSRLDIQLSQEQLDAIANCVPRSVEGLLKQVREKILTFQMSSTRSTTPECSAENCEDANNHMVNRNRGRTASMIPRAPSKSITPPPVGRPTRPKSSFEICSDNEKNLVIKELQETNELLLAKISKLEQLLALKDRKIESLMTKLQSSNNAYSSPSP